MSAGQPVTSATTTTPEPTPGRSRTRKGLRILVLLLVGMLVVGGLVLVKLWQTSPPGVEPVIKVSVLDLLQSRSLAATARRDAAAGEIDKSLHAWGGALANNLANAALWRELLEQLAADTSVTNDLAAPYLTSVGWFCTLTRTNAADVVLAARVCERHDAFEELAALPLPDSPEAVPELTALRLQGLFRLGRIYEFIPLFERNREQLAEQPGFDLYRLAYLAGWGTPEDRTDWQERLASAAQAAGRERLGRKLGIIVANQLGDPDTAVRLIKEMDAAGESSMTDRALLWLTLAGRNRKLEALMDVAGRQLFPRNATDLNLIAGACIQLGLTNQCEQILMYGAPRLGRSRTPESANVWMVWGGTVMDWHDWVGMRRIADTIRRIPGSHDWLDGYADFLEGYGARQMAEGPLSENRLARAAKASYPLGNLGVAVADGLSTLGHNDWAGAILRPMEERFSHNPAYWRAAWSVALREHQDPDRLMQAAVRLQELEPNDRFTRFNYAAALLVRRERPAEAQRILFDLRQGMARSLYTELNYAFALVRNLRLDEAREILSGINASTLSDAVAPSYHLCQMELFLESGDPDRAAAAFRKIDQRGFFPCQIQWLKEQAAKLDLAK